MDLLTYFADEPTALHAVDAPAVSGERDAVDALLDVGAAVLFPEPAHDGFDRSVFAATLLHDRFVAAFVRHPAPKARCFVLPYQQARSLHRFYFEQGQLDALPDFVVEV